MCGQGGVRSHLPRWCSLGTYAILIHGSQCNYVLWFISPWLGTDCNDGWSSECRSQFLPLLWSNSCGPKYLRIAFLFHGIFANMLFSFISEKWYYVSECIEPWSKVYKLFWWSVFAELPRVWPYITHPTIIKGHISHYDKSGIVALTSMGVCRFWFTSGSSVKYESSH